MLVRTYVLGGTPTYVRVVDLHMKTGEAKVQDLIISDSAAHTYDACTYRAGRRGANPKRCMLTPPESSSSSSSFKYTSASPLFNLSPLYTACRRLSATPPQVSSHMWSIVPQPCVHMWFSLLIKVSCLKLASTHRISIIMILYAFVLTFFVGAARDY